MLEVREITVQFGSYTAIDRLSFSVEEGQWLMIVGPNGAGKSTVLRTITQELVYSGHVLFDGMDVRRMKAVDRARGMGVLTQSHFMGYAFTVEEVARLGRYAYKPGFFSSHAQKEDDEKAVEEALSMTGMLEKRKQSVLTLSGGELQRTFLAQVLAQGPRLLLLDEPSNHLDLLYQKQVFSLVSDWILQGGRSVVSVVHDLSLAKAFGTHAILIHEGKAVAAGEIGEVLSPDHLNPVYGMDVRAWMRQMLGQWE